KKTVGAAHFRRRFATRKQFLASARIVLVTRRPTVGSAHSRSEKGVTRPAAKLLLGQLFQRVRFQIFERDKFERGSVGGFEINRRSAVVIEGGFPAGNADAPFVAGFQSGKTPFRDRRD